VQADLQRLVRHPTTMWQAGLVTEREDEAGVWYWLGRARTMGMLVARTDEEGELVRQIQARFGGTRGVESPPKPLGELVPLTDAEFEMARSAIGEQFKPLREAYLRGMVIARDDEQREVLVELRLRIGPPRDS
jgi:hypothetical protein